MQAEILMIGTELLLGQIEDTNATYMARVLAENGIGLFQKSTVGDNHDRICHSLKDALARCDVVLCSGGLGPTEDDITRECVAEVLDRTLEYHEEIYQHIESMFAKYRFKLTENNKKQAFVPNDAIVIDNPNGTAPGLIVESEKGTVICMPGVPRELKAMLTDQVVPYLRERFELKDLIHYRVLKVCGLGESRVDAAIGDIMNEQENPTVGVLANPAWVRIRIAAKASSIEEADAMIDEVDAKVRERLPGLIMGVDDDTLEKVVDELLKDRGWTLSLVETNSGGMIAQRMTSENCAQLIRAAVVPMAGLTEVDADNYALELAHESLIQSSADCALAVVCDPIQGRTCAVFSCPDGDVRWEFGRTGTDERMQLRTCVQALEHIRRHLTAP